MKFSKFSLAGAILLGISGLVSCGTTPSQPIAQSQDGHDFADCILPELSDDNIESTAPSKKDHVEI